MPAPYETLRDDLSFLRAIAAEGRDRPLTAGPWIFSAGLIYGVASLVCWAIVRRLIPLPLDAILWCWCAAALIQVLWLIRLGRSRTIPSSALSTTNRTVAAVWTALGWAIFASFLAACCAAWTSGSQMVWMTFPSFVLAIYGAGWSVTGLIAGRRELRWVAALSFIGAVALLPAFRTSALFLVYGVLILCIAALPGWRLMRLARDAGV
ncbi:hypothetical protein [Acidomonas methanolica]|uniref:hypothetical protein n=1 Tax=Acidomonas methanolica TaxID=437 RepID=UPI002119CF73|nr:hypothetical protein [Acidomonas methanolica]MCQ9154671.1 hypothetical protein [Acidomonas methanolica]